ncbi:MAG: blue (type 1) copper domain protein [Candidatus Saccharibacteria bacterium]|nr:blue (type 1) copper domain protein [Candidatus Saccharibacteria bacterium]
MNKLIAAIVAVIIIAAGIGVAISRHNKNNNSNNPATTQSTSTTQSSNTQSSTNSGPVPTGANEISIINMNFSPASISVKKGTTIKWINQDNIPHTATENDGKNGPSSPQLAHGETYSFTFNEVGTFHYHCSIHPNMTAVVTVTE